MSTKVRKMSRSNTVQVDGTYFCYQLKYIYSFSQCLSFVHILNHVPLNKEKILRLKLYLVIGFKKKSLSLVVQSLSDLWICNGMNKFMYEMM